MDIMLKHHPHDYLPAAGHDALLPGYDLLTRLFGFNRVHEKLIGQAELADNHRVLEIGCGTGNLTIRAKRAHPSASVIGSDPTH
jgi:ubiquinone/menaquinone biosynthesis C-methylase UbiE